MIRAAAISQKPVLIVGTGPNKADLERLAATLKAPVEFLGFQKNEQVKELINEATAVVIPSIWAENMPLTLLEAMSLGKIVIASRIGGLPEIIQDGENGLLFNPGDTAHLIKKINQLDSIDKTALSRAAAKTALALSPQKNLDAILKAYQELINKNPD